MNLASFLSYAPSSVSMAQPAMEETDKLAKKQGIKNMLGGMGKKNEIGVPEGRPVQGLDVPSLLASLFGG